MLDFSVSWLPLLVVAIANFFLSWIYYSPISPLFKKWQMALGIDPNKRTMTEEDKKAMPRMMGGAVVATFLFAFGMQVFYHSLHLTTVLDGMKLGFVAWFTFAVTHSLNTQFEGRKPVVLVINNLLYLVTYVGFGALLSVWK